MNYTPAGYQVVQAPNATWNRRPTGSTKSNQSYLQNESKTIKVTREYIFISFRFGAFLRRLGDVSSCLCEIFMGSLTITICDCGNQNGYLKPNHDLLLTLTKWIMWLKVSRA